MMSICVPFDSVPTYGVYAQCMYTIGKIAKLANVGVETIRFYERQGLIKQPRKRIGGGFRKYSEDDAQAVRFIKRTQELGFKLREVKELLELNLNPRTTCEIVGERAERKLAEVEAKLQDLLRMKKALQLLKLACDQNPQSPACRQMTDCFEGDC